MFLRLIWCFKLELSSNPEENTWGIDPLKVGAALILVPFLSTKPDIWLIEAQCRTLLSPTTSPRYPHGTEFGLCQGMQKDLMSCWEWSRVQKSLVDLGRI